MTFTFVTDRRWADIFFMLMKGTLDMGISFTAKMAIAMPAAQKITRGTAFMRITVGFGQMIAAHQVGNLLRIEFIILLFTAMNGLHIIGMPQIKGNIIKTTGIGQPIIVIG